MKNILVIGASSGIGKYVAESLVKSGNNVYAAQRRSAEIPGVKNIPYDVTSQTPISPLPDVLDGLVYCPGTINLKPFNRISDTELREEFEINFFGAFRILQACLPALKKSAQASVVFFSTVAVQTGMPFHAGIASAKGAIEGLTRSLAAELAPSIRVNAIAPSLTDTPLANKLLNTDAKQESARQRHPLKRYGSTEDVGNAVLWLLSAQSSWVTGQILHIDGGMSSLKV
ncbi:SDR family NAD(P)-dependent oxidoreductase [Thermaurantimonas aggregans]|uniref:SDR family NAD(P)-dependent oxidoreductase n=1 Tax=Thermaurantimonas aggregans TaxID=2173829 RepID=UPI0023EF6DBE|nr:SDR family oxidoreductase [Thermaurantimonas aggregans]MCX8147642.1 SDR family oxidoreductase [Thermaurantimonas aggregans]